MVLEYFYLYINKLVYILTKLYISVVSHGHDDIILKLNCLAKLSLEDGIEVVIKDNLGGANKTLSAYCSKAGIHYINSNPNIGFGENNNFIFNWCKNRFKFDSDDFFLILNPDVFVESTILLSLIERSTEVKAELSTINLFKDFTKLEYDPAVRNFPKFSDFITSFLFARNNSIIDKTLVTERKDVDWAAGSFLLFTTNMFEKLNGFDSRYFMYCEDLDICWRASQNFNSKVTFFPNLHAIHLVGHNNRKIYSKHFFWHLSSVTKYLLKTYGLYK